MRPVHRIYTHTHTQILFTKYCPTRVYNGTLDPMKKKGAKEISGASDLKFFVNFLFLDTNIDSYILKSIDFRYYKIKIYLWQYFFYNFITITKKEIIILKYITNIK